MWANAVLKNSNQMHPQKREQPDCIGVKVLRGNPMEVLICRHQIG